MQIWVIYTIIHAIFAGFFQCSKKKSSEINSIYEVLAAFSLISFFMAAFTSTNNFNIELQNILLIALKSLIIVVAWLLGIYSMTKMPISLYSVINLSRIIFSIILSVIFLGEKLTLTIITGAIIIIIGLILVNKVSQKDDDKEVELKIVLLLLFSCFLNSVASVIDKVVTKYVTATQLQFWFLFFLALFFWLIILARRKKLEIQKLKKNYWILVAAVSLVVGDRFLFMANANPDSKVAIMTLLKQISVIEGIILGKIIFKEKNIVKKMLCSILIIFGILLTII